jgi:hypothetical protein
MTYFFSHSTVTSDDKKLTPKLHLLWVCPPRKNGRNMRYWGKTKKEAWQKAKDANPGCDVLWKKEL